jgi:CRISPR-associated protein Csm1
MSIQIFLQGKLLGIDEFLFAPADQDHDQVFTGRSHWISLLSEILPRALLAELGLAKILLGSSGGGQFLLVLPQESRDAAEAFLRAAAAEIAALSDGSLKLLWSVTENLGDWSDVRRRLTESMDHRRGTPLDPSLSVIPSGSEGSVGPPDPVGNATFVEQAPHDAASHDYFAGHLGMRLRDAESAAWSPETPGRILIGEGKHVWSLAGSSIDPLPFARHAAPSDAGTEPASTANLASRAAGLKTWGVLRGDVDNFGIRIRRAQTIEEHIQLSVMFKQFFAGELEVLCSMPEFWRKVTVIFSGGDDFAVYGAWDALVGLARELERLFHRFAETNLKDFAGLEGKTITMALALAPARDASLGAVFEEAGQRLEAAKSSDKDCIWLLGRTLEWKQFAEAADLKDSLMRMIGEFHCSPQYLRDLCGIYRETQSKMSRRQARRTGGERPWRYHRRIRRILSAARPVARRERERNEFQKARTSLIADLIGRSAVTVKLRPAGRVALEWARLSAE